jgi:hypothetical protein
MADGLWCIIAHSTGSFRVRARGVAYGISVIYDEGAGRNFRAFYATRRTSSAFFLSVVFSDRDTYQAFGDWLVNWGGRAADPSPNPPVQPYLRVTIPAIGFDKSGVLTSGVTFGESAGDITRSMMLQFLGARDVGVDVTLVHSSFKNVDREVSAEVPYFYPAGIQLSGSQKGDDAIYEDPDYLKAAPVDTSWKQGKKGVS